MGKLRGPLVSFGGGEIVVEYPFGVLWVNIYDSFLDVVKPHFSKLVAIRHGVIDFEKVVGEKGPDSE